MNSLKRREHYAFSPERAENHSLITRDPHPGPALWFPSSRCVRNKGGRAAFEEAPEIFHLMRYLNSAEYYRDRWNDIFLPRESLCGSVSENNEQIRRRVFINEEALYHQQVSRKGQELKESIHGKGHLG
ncbi:hypothetical protein AVEN_250752-1 [Araneus ventricosus]|uniref:Uncharacterized protein n=1 Tax=Araneus ventricosus TaxID=182803 RepID=A0A4Y2E1A7_ARAVE|nr:hypothetical protein AVEN_250752-1 [Araneus ventricosus]